jgi:Tol biopolymer transport system component
LLSAAADGSGQVDTLVADGALKRPTSWSRGGAVLFYTQAGTDGGGADIWALREGQPEQILATRFTERNPAVSPDGRWLAYESNRSERYEIYVRPYPGPGPEATVSTQGGLNPVWARDGTELFFESEGGLMAVAVDITSGFRADAPRALFEGRYVTGANAPNYDVAPDGEHFVFVRARGGDEGGGGGRLILVENFFEELRRLVPVN